MADWEGYMDGRNTAESWDDALSSAEKAEAEADFRDDMEARDLPVINIGNIADSLFEEGLNPQQVSRIVESIRGLQQLYLDSCTIPFDGTSEPISRRIIDGVVESLRHYMKGRLPRKGEIDEAFKIYLDRSTK